MLAIIAAFMTFGCFCGGCESDEKLVLETRRIAVGTLLEEVVRVDALIGTDSLDGELASARLDATDAIVLEDWDPSGKVVLRGVSPGEAVLSVTVNKDDRAVKEEFKLEAVKIDAVEVISCAPDAVHVRGTKARFKLEQTGSSLSGERVEVPAMLPEFPLALPTSDGVSLMANSYKGDGFVVDVEPGAPDRVTLGPVDGIDVSGGSELVFIDPSEIDDIILKDVKKGTAPLLQPKKRYAKRRAGGGTQIEVVVMSKGRRVCLDHQISFRYTNPGICSMNRIEPSKPAKVVAGRVTQSSWFKYSGRRGEGYHTYLKFDHEGQCELVGQLHFGELLIESKTPLVIDVAKALKKRRRRR